MGVLLARQSGPGLVGTLKLLKSNMVYYVVYVWSLYFLLMMNHGSFYLIGG